jgi:dTDP-4-amino-4,6-dideoxygalactose transaminase
VASPRAAALVNEVLQSERLAGIGPFGKKCEALLEAVTGCGRALLTPSCTHALEMAAVLLDAAPGDEVIVPSFTFVSTANAFAMHGLQPIFADCVPETLNVDPVHVERLITPRTRAVVAMHYAGVACDLDAIGTIASSRHLRLIEDNAHGLMGTYKGRPLGTFGSVATQSFDETKNITCGQGGALLVNDPALAERADVLRQRGTNRARFYRGEVDKYTWIDLGSNWVLSELHAALLFGHLTEREAIQRRRHRVWTRYDEGLRAWARAQGVRQPHIPNEAGHPAHLYYLILPTADARDRLILHLRERSIQSVFHYAPLNASSMGQRLGGRPGDCPVAEDLSPRLLRLPFFDTLTASEQDEVIATVLTFEV